MGSTFLEIPNWPNSDEFEVKMLVAGILYEKGKLTAGQAAAIVGISKRAFLEALGRFGFSVFGYDGEEIASEKENLATWRESL